MQTFHNRCNSISFQNWFTAALPKHFHLAFALQCIDTDWLILPSLMYTQCWLTKRTQVNTVKGREIHTKGRNWKGKENRKSQKHNHNHDTYRPRKLLWYYFTKNGQLIRGMPSSSIPLMKWFPGWSSEWSAHGKAWDRFGLARLLNAHHRGEEAGNTASNQHG